MRKRKRSVSRSQLMLTIDETDFVRIKIYRNLIIFRLFSLFHVIQLREEENTNCDSSAGFHGSRNRCK